MHLQPTTLQNILTAVLKSLGFANEEPQTFLAWLEEVHGYLHPPIVTLSYEQVRKEMLM